MSKKLTIEISNEDVELLGFISDYMANEYTMIYQSYGRDEQFEKSYKLINKIYDEAYKLNK